VSKEWDFVSKGTEISLGKFVLEHFTPLTLDVQTGVVSDEEIAEIWEAAKKEAMEKVRGNKNRSASQRGQTHDHLWQTKRRWKRPSGLADQTVGW
jgi:hypothetical protein